MADTAPEAIPVPTWEGAESPGGGATPPPEAGVRGSASTPGRARERGRATEEQDRGRSRHRGRGQGRGRDNPRARAPHDKGKSKGSKGGGKKGMSVGKGHTTYATDATPGQGDTDGPTNTFRAGWSQQFPGWYRSPSTGHWMFWTGAQWLSYEPTAFMDGS